MHLRRALNEARELTGERMDPALSDYKTIKENKKGIMPG